MKIKISDSNVTFERKRVIFDKEEALKVIIDSPFFKRKGNCYFKGLSDCNDDFVIDLADVLLDYGIILVALMKNEL